MNIGCLSSNLLKPTIGFWRLNTSIGLRTFQTTSNTVRRNGIANCECAISLSRGETECDAVLLRKPESMVAGRKRKVRCGIKNILIIY